MKPLSNYPELLRLLEKYSPAGQNYAQLILEIENKSNSSDMIVPVLGTQGMGKSTMINAILGEDILPSEADETTCVPVEIRYGVESHGVVHFVGNKPEVIVKSKSDLSKFVDNNFNHGNEKQVSHIVLYRDYSLLKTGLVIVDLPGVGSLTKANEETTKRYIENLCVAVFIISTSPPILKTEANFITSVWRSFNSAYFVQNVWDDNSTEEVNEGLAHNQKVLADISRKINAPMLHPIIPVNAYAAAKGMFEKKQELIQNSNVNTLLEALNSFAVSYRTESTSALEARINQLIASTAEQAERWIQQANMTNEELLAAMEVEKKHFESASYEVEEIATSIKRQLNSDRREVQSFASATARKYSELLRTEVFHLVDQGVVDGDLLSNAFTDYQSQYATEAMDEVYEKLSTIWDNLKAKLEELDDILQREAMQSPDASAFNKAQAFKWEKGVDATIKIGSAVGSALAFGALYGGPLGVAAAFAAALAIGLVGSFIGSKSRKEVTKARGRETKRELEPYIADFKESLAHVINDSFSKFADQTLARLDDYISARSEQLAAIQNRINDLKENGATINREIDVMEKERDYLVNWRPDND